MDFSRCKLSLQVMNFKALDLDRRALLGLLIVKSIRTLYRSNQMITRLAGILVPMATLNGEFVVRNDMKKGHWIFVGEAYSALDTMDLEGVREQTTHIEKVMPLLINGEEYGAIDLSIKVELGTLRFIKRKGDGDICEIPRRVRILE
ncbi:beta protein [Hayes Yard virus]|uniref:Beta protein n=1 Tax=Hayes Yard virus TaxID=2602440 RepID=A0A7D0IN58_9RHAB|nr:beta protein [Hayes Yard virus]QEA08657.1 beta protein [Hayes Yard virus]